MSRRITSILLKKSKDELIQLITDVVDETNSLAVCEECGEFIVLEHECELEMCEVCCKELCEKCITRCKECESDMCEKCNGIHLCEKNCEE